MVLDVVLTAHVCVAVVSLLTLAGMPEVPLQRPAVPVQGRDNI